MSYAYQEDTGKKDQGKTFLEKVSALSVPDEYDPAIMAATTPGASDNGDTYKTSSK
jgi:hypothetical protein